MGSKINRLSKKNEDVPQYQSFTKISKYKIEYSLK